MVRFTLLAGLFIVTACSEGGEAGEALSQNADDLPARSPAPIPGADSTWTTGAIGGEAAAVFLSPAREPLFSILCDGEGGIILQRHLQTPARAMAMEVRWAGGARTLAANGAGSNPTMLRAVLPRNDGFIAKLADRGASVSVTGGPALALPPNPMIGEFIRDCPR